MQHSTKQPTKRESRRFRRLREIGCIACRLNGHLGVPAEVHHVVEGGRRRGHRDSIPLCTWHHRGQPIGNLAPSRAEVVYGPSLARSKRNFVETYGTEDELLALTDRLVEQQEALTV